MADEKSDNPGPTTIAAGGHDDENEISLGQYLSGARKNRGLTQEDVIRETHIPVNYVRAIETDNYGLISDQLYLVPFLRKYAAFLELDPEDIAARFVRDVLRTESTVIKIVEPIPMMPSTREKSGRSTYFGIALLLIAIALLVADLTIRKNSVLHGLFNRSAAPSASPSSAPPEPAAQASGLPLGTSITPVPDKPAP